jgi:hypothetical protein
VLLLVVIVIVVRFVDEVVVLGRRSFTTEFKEERGAVRVMEEFSGGMARIYRFACDGGRVVEYCIMLLVVSVSWKMGGWTVMFVEAS